MDQNNTLEPGKSFRINLDGSLAINYLSAEVADGDKASAATGEAWRNLVLVATFDGARQPQIWCPLGDFFGSSPGFHPYAVASVRCGGIRRRAEDGVVVVHAV